MAEKEQSIEHIFAKHLVSSKNYGANDNGYYEWENSYWKLKTEDQMKTLIATYIYKNDASKFDNKHINSSYNAAKYIVKKVPVKSINDKIIPFKNKWLQISDDGAFRVLLPTKDIGITWSLNVANKDITPLGEGTEFDIPTKYYEKSKFFRNYIESSLVDIDLRKNIQEYIGYGLLNSNEKQICQFWIGDGSNGKSVLLKLVETLHENKASVDLDEIDGFNAELIVGASLLISPDGARKPIKEHFLKKLIGSDNLVIRPIYGKPINYKFTGQLIASCNELPIIREMTHGMWRRLVFIPWDTTIAANDRIDLIEEKIIDNNDEYMAFVYWALEGLQRYIKNGRKFTESEKIQNFTNVVMGEVDKTKLFLDEMCLENTDDRTAMITKSELYTSYYRYCRFNGYEPSSNSMFFSKIKRYIKGIDKEIRIVDKSNVRHRIVPVTINVQNINDVNNVVASFPIGLEFNHPDRFSVEQSKDLKIMWKHNHIGTTLIKAEEKILTVDENMDSDDLEDAKVIVQNQLAFIVNKINNENSKIAELFDS